MDDLVFYGVISLFIVSFYFIILGIRLSPSRRFEWDGDSNIYVYVEKRPFFYRGRPLKWFPARAKASYGTPLLDPITIQCILLADEDTNYAHNLVEVYNATDALLCDIAQEICRAMRQKNYPEVEQGKQSWIEVSKKRYFKLYSNLEAQNIKLEKFVIRNRFGKAIDKYTIIE
jgi:hypothetical protein